MDVVEYNILNRRKQFKKRRNFMRRVLLLFVLSLFVFFSYKLYDTSLKTTTNIVIKNNYYVSTSFLVNFIEQKLSGKSFFLINPRQISNDLVKAVPVFKSVLIRRYLLPENKLIVYLLEKNIWAKVFFSENILSFEDVYLTDNGDIIYSDYLIKENIPQGLVKVYLPKNDIPNQKTLFEIKKIYELVTGRVDLPVSALLITKNNEISVFTNFGFQVKCGKLDGFIKERILNLKKIPKVLDLLKTGYYKSGYLDLTLENAAVLKANNMPLETDKSKKIEKKSNIFNILKRDNTKSMLE